MKYLLLLLALLVAPQLHAKEEQRKCPMGRDYWLYTPDTIDSQKTYWLVVGVHGAGGQGKGAAGLASWVNEMDNVIVIGPTFPSKGPYYQGLEGETDTQLLNIQKTLQKEFKIYPKMFLYGFSGGSQYSHRFALKHPESVIGVSANSGGTWDLNVTPAAKKIIWTISCGSQDQGLSTPGDKMGRLDYFRAFYAAMDRSKGFTCKPFVTNAGHRPAPEVGANTKECFRVASTGMFDYQREATKGMAPAQREAWIMANSQLTDTSFDDGKNKYTLKANKDGWTVGPDALRVMAETRRLVPAK